MEFVTVLIRAFEISEGKEAAEQVVSIEATHRQLRKL